MARMVDLIKNDGDDNSSSRGNKRPISSGQSGGSGGGISFSAAAASAGTTAAPSRKRETSLGGPSGGSTNLSSPTSLDAKTKFCPYLGGRKDKSKIIEYPASTNVCYGEESREKKLLRTITLPFSLVPAPRQREFCLATFRRCPIYQANEKENSA